MSVAPQNIARLPLASRPLTSWRWCGKENSDSRDTTKPSWIRLLETAPKAEVKRANIKLYIFHLNCGNFTGFLCIVYWENFIHLFFFRTQAKLVVTLVCGGISEKKNSPGEGERRQCVCEEERNLDTRS